MRLVMGKYAVHCNVARGGPSNGRRRLFGKVSICGCGDMLAETGPQITVLAPLPGRSNRPCVCVCTV